MKNPFYTKYMTQLVESYHEVDNAVDKIERAGGRAEHWQLEELRDLLAKVMPVVDTIPLPSAARRAGRDAGDFFYLTRELVAEGLEDAVATAEPTVREARKYESLFEDAIALDATKVEQMLSYREKARESLRKPANSYGLSAERSFMPHSADIEGMIKPT